MLSKQFFALLAGIVGVGLNVGFSYNGATLSSHSWTQVYGGTKTWITSTSRKTSRGANWGGLSSSVYQFSFGSPSNTRLIVLFSRRKNGDETSQIYYSNLRLDLRFDRGIPSVYADGTQMKHPYLSVTSQGGGWYVDGKPNYNLNISVYGPSGLGTNNVPFGSRLDAVFNVGGHNGVPTWETRILKYNPHPQWGYPRFWAARRLATAPPFKVQAGTIPGFPFLRIGANSANWFVENPTPFFFDTHTQSVTLNPFVGFEQAGTYQINSLTLPPFVDFESPVIFYNFINKSREAQLTLRAQSFPKGDPFGTTQVHGIPQASYRLSWKTSSLNKWSYSLDVAGLVPYSQSVKVGSYHLWGISANSALPWVLSNRWPFVTFVHDPLGYPGSEGIYTYTDQVGSTWDWLLGLVNNPPSQFSHPYLPSTNASLHGLPPHFFGEYSSEYFHKPSLYLSPIDHHMHLMYAQGGVWNIGNNQVVRMKNLDSGPYIDEWELQSIPKSSGIPKAAHGKTLARLIVLPQYMVYSSAAGVEIKHLGLDFHQALLTMKPPSSQTSWLNFVQSTKNVSSRNPIDMASWINDFSGSVMRATSTKINSVQSLNGKYDLAVNVASGAEQSGLPLIGFNDHKGSYILSLDQKTGIWTTSTNALSNVRSSISAVGPLVAGLTSSFQVRASASNSTGWWGPVSIKVGSKVMYENNIWLNRGKQWGVPLFLPAHHVGPIKVSLTIGTTTKTQSFYVAKQSRPFIEVLASSLENPYMTGETVLLLLIVVGIGRITWRRADRTRNG